MTDNMKKKRLQDGTIFLLLGLLSAFICFLDMPIGILAMVAAGISPADPPTGWTMLIVLCPVIVLWALACAGIVLAARNRLGFHVFQRQGRPSLLQAAAAIGILVFFIVQNYFNWDQQLHSVGEYRMLAEQVGSMAGLAFSVQYLYYVGEMALVSLCIALTQEFAERKFRMTRVPIGGLFAGVLWGFLMHVRQGLIPGLQGLITGILFGCLYLLMKKNMKLAFPLIYLGFVL